MTSDVAVDDPLPQQQQGSPSGADTCAQKKINENNRRSNKPIMEKKRRARINNCLNELKTLILDATKKDPARHSKLEKADILEMTVKHLESVQRRGVVAAAESTAANKFEAGFAECTNEINRFPGLEPHVRARLMQHLGSYFDKEIGGVPIPPAETPSVQLHLRDSGRRNAILVGATAGSAGGPVRLVPTRLPNGDIALVLPSVTTTPPPALTTMTRSDSSGTESPPAPDRPESGGGRSAADDAYGQSELPLALVAKHVRTDDERPDAERPWRPW